MPRRTLDSGDDQSRPSKRTKIGRLNNEEKHVSSSDQAFWALPELNLPSTSDAAYLDPNKNPYAHVAGGLESSVVETQADSHLSLVYGESVPCRQLGHTYDEWDQIEYDPPAGQDERRTSYVDPTKVSEIRARRRKLFEKVLEKVDRNQLDEFAYLCEKLKDFVQKEGKTWTLALESEEVKKLADRFKQLHTAEMSQATKDLATLFIQCTGPFAPLKSVSSSKIVGPVFLAPMLGNISHEALKKANNTICNRVMSVAGANLFRAQRKFAIFGRGASNREEKRAGVSKKRAGQQEPEAGGAVQRSAVQPEVSIDLDNLQSVVDNWIPPAESKDQPFEQQGPAAMSHEELAWFASGEVYPLDSWQNDWVTGQEISPDDPLLQLDMPGESSQPQQSWVNDQSFELNSLTEDNLAQLAHWNQLPPEVSFPPEQPQDDWMPQESIRQADPPLQPFAQYEESQTTASPFTGDEYRNEPSLFAKWLQMCHLQALEAEGLQAEYL